MPHISPERAKEKKKKTKVACRKGIATIVVQRGAKKREQQEKAVRRSKRENQKKIKLEFLI